MPYGFDIAEGTARTFWCNTNGSSTYYIGQLVAFTIASKAQGLGTVTPLAVPAGLNDSTNDQVVAGIVVGFSDQNPVYNATYGQYITGVATQAAQLTRKTTGIYNQGRGMYAPKDPQALVEVAEILPTTLIKGYICQTGGNAPRVLTSSAADTTGGTSALTTNACEFTPVANTCTIYCRTGTNAGLYRVTNDTSATAPAVTIGFPEDVAIGDTFVRAAIKQGSSQIYISGPGLYIDNTLGASASNCFSAFVYHLDLREAGKEYAVFRFSPLHFIVGRPT